MWVMSIWILAIIIVGLTVLAGWRLGGIRAAIGFVGILFATLLCGLVGKLFHLLLPVFGVSNPIYLWALSPVLGFMLVSIIFSIIAFNVHRKVDTYYRYQAGDLRQALFERLNTRLGLCLGVLNGVIYFALISFFIFNLTYWTTQATAAAAQPSALVRFVNSCGEGLESTGFARTSTSVGKLSPNFYKFADLTGFMLQNPQAGPRFAEYPALASLWEDDRMLGLITDGTLTNAIVSGTSVGEVMKMQSVQAFLQNKELRNHVEGILTTNIDDLMPYLQTGKSAKYDGEKFLGRWQFNASVTLAWFRQSQPKIQAKEMAAIRALWSAAYSSATFQLTSDNQVFVKNFPKFANPPQANQPLFNPENWKGDWTREGEACSIHLKLNETERFMTATTTDGLRMSVKDGRTMLIFDRIN
jgi:hypothetical protein